jgi:hypothetical protein
MTSALEEPDVDAGIEDYLDSGTFNRGVSWADEEDEEESNVVRVEVGSDDQRPVVCAAWAASDLGAAIKFFTKELVSTASRGCLNQRCMSCMSFRVNFVSRESWTACCRISPLL